MPQPQLLCFHMGEEKLSKIRLCAMRYKIRVRVVTQEEEGLALGELLGLPAPESVRHGDGPVAEEMMVMALFPAGMVDALLRLMRQMKTPPVALKAVLTQANSAWDARALYAELAQEREAFAKGTRAEHGEG
ncbi:MAG: DUF3783 domain-containing protein [Clostridia bacterium]|nr:DUF3783 domain-containing protein [Clostridia bacterium]